MEAIDPPIQMKINSIEIINEVARRFQLSLPREIVRLGYDSETDVLYAHFVDNAAATDSEIIPENENIILGLNDNDDTIRITIMNASKQIESQ